MLLSSSLVFKAFMEKRVFDLFLLILKQAEEVYQNKGMLFPVIVSSTILFLASVKSASLSQTAKALGKTTLIKTYASAKGSHYLASNPGEVRKYSNLAAGLAGHIVEEVTGLTLANYSKKIFFLH
ncbi:MAG: hypothetical protein ACI9IA_002227 [Enterobacterales bacterium]|jgi:hypothetical protein